MTPRWGDRDEEPAVPDELPSRPLEVFAALDAHEVDYVTIGGIAMQGHGHLRATYDVDLVFAPDAENLERAPAALRDLRARIGGVDGHCGRSASATQPASDVLHRDLVRQSPDHSCLWSIAGLGGRSRRPAALKPTSLTDPTIALDGGCRTNLRRW